LIKLHIEELALFAKYNSNDKIRRMRWEMHLARIGCNRNIYVIGGKARRKEAVGKTKM
jgi:hypothetical protein